MDGETYDARTGEVVEARPQVPMQPPAERNLIFASPDCGEVFGALAEAQGSMENPKKTKTAKVKGRTKTGGEYEYSYAYAPLDEIVNVIREPLAKAGLIHRQFLSTRGQTWVMRTVIAHRSGQWYGCDYPIFWDETRGMQGFASGVTYARRYGLMMALGLVGEDDDDANVADGNPATVASKGRTAQGSAGAAATGSARSHTPQAAPASPERDAAQVRYKEMRNEIDASMSEQDARAIDGCPAWVTMEKMIRDLEPAATADNAIQMLRDRIENRVAMLQDQPDSGGGY